MSQKIIARILEYGRDEAVKNMVVAANNGRLTLDYYQAGPDKQSLTLPIRSADSFFPSLRHLASLAPHELVSQKYCKVPSKNNCFNFYLTIMPEGGGEKAIISPVKKSATIWRLNQLGLQRHDLQAIKEALSLKSGLVLISSPDNSGRGATLNSLLLELNESDKSIYALMKYRAYDIVGVSALEAKPANWEKVIQIDSDIIFSDDLDNPRSLEMAIRAADSGRLVFGAIKAADSFQVLEKILALKMPLKLKLDNLKIITNQRLTTLKKRGRKDSPDTRGHIGVFEILKITPAIKKFLTIATLQNFSDYRADLARLTAKEGFHSLEDDRRRKIKDGIIQ